MKGVIKTRLHSVRLVSWIRKKIFVVSLAKRSQLQLDALGTNNLNGQYFSNTHTQTNTKNILLTANDADSFGFMYWSFEISSKFSITTPDTMEVTGILLAVLKVLKNYNWKT